MGIISLILTKIQMTIKARTMTLNHQNMKEEDKHEIL